MTALLLLHVVLGLGIVTFGTALGRRGLAVGVLAPLATLVWLATQLGTVVDGGVVTEQVTWVSGLDLTIDLRLDAFAALMVLLVSGIGVLVFAYAASYFPPHREGLGRLVGVLTLFSGAMVGLVLADNLLLLYACWELTSVTSYLLIGNDHTEPKARAAALHALLVTGAGGLAMLGGFVVIGQAAGTFQLSAILADPPAGVVGAALGLVLLGAITKSAQYPFHSWLPGAMVAPTPVSAYLHSATMVKAGVYLVARLAPVFAVLELWRPSLLTIGLITMVAGGLRALRQHDLKLLLAFGTVSQLGFMMVLFGAGTTEAALAGCALLLAHGAFKAALFMVVGVIDHEAGTRDIRLLPPLAGGWRPLKVVAVVSAASMAGIPLTFGFVAKEAAYTAFAHGQVPEAGLVLAGLVAGSALTFAYSARFLWGAFVAPSAAGRAEPEAVAPVHVPTWAFVAPGAVLAVLTVVVGVAPGVASPLTAAAVRALDPGSQPAALSLWHGVTLPLVLSGATFAVGALLFLARRRVARVLAAGHAIPSGASVYRATLVGLNVVADRVTGVVQSGSLPVYAGVILSTAAVLPLVPLLTSGGWPGLPPWIASPAQLPVAAVLIDAAVAASVVRRRFSAALFLGTVGYAMAGLFVIQGAPDLALTQVAVETLTTVLFVLVLRRLPDRFEHRAPLLGRVSRTGVSVAVGLMVFVFAITAAASRTEVPVSGEMVARSLPDGQGRNVVNVILVEFRGFDTLGEITVLAVAAIGAVALARARRPHPPAVPAGSAEVAEGGS